MAYACENLVVNGKGCKSTELGVITKFVTPA